MVIISKDDPVACARYARENNLLDTEGWKHLRRIGRREKKFNRMLKQAILKAKHHGPIWKFGVRVPRTSKEAAQLDKELKQTKWADAEALELAQLHEYHTFKDKEKNGNPLKVTRLSRFSLFMMSNMISDTKQDVLLVVI